jgi:hypothetical protein
MHYFCGMKQNLTIILAFPGIAISILLLLFTVFNSGKLHNMLINNILEKRPYCYFTVNLQYFGSFCTVISLLFFIRFFTLNSP